MELEEPHHTERPETIGVTTNGEQKIIDVPLDTTVLHIKLNDVQRRVIAEELVVNDNEV